MKRQFSTRILRMIKSEIAEFVDAAQSASAEGAKDRRVSELVGHLRAELGKTIAERHRKTKELSTIQQELSVLMQKAEFAVGEDRDDLAKAVLDRKHNLQIKRDSLSSALHRLNETASQLEDAISFLTDASGVQDPSAQPLASKLAELDLLIQQTAANSSKPGKPN